MDVEGVYNDDEWHILNVRRRGNEMSVWVDDMQPTEGINSQKHIHSCKMFCNIHIVVLQYIYFMITFIYFITW